MLFKRKKRTNKCCEIIQSHRDYSFKKTLSSLGVSSGRCTVTQRKACNTQQSLYVTWGGKNRPAKIPRGTDLTNNGSKELERLQQLLCRSITHAALEPLADEGDRNGSHSTAFSGPLLPAASARGLQCIHCFALCTTETKKDQKKPRRSTREELPLC